jgi:hypothetical protein
MVGLVVFSAPSRRETPKAVIKQNKTLVAFQLAHRAHTLLRICISSARFWENKCLLISP